MKFFPLAAATVVLLGTAACSNDTEPDDRASSPAQESAPATAGQSPQEVAQRFLLAFATKDAAGLCDLVLENGAPFPADERDACIERFELDFAPAHAHEEAHEHGEEDGEQEGTEDAHSDEDGGQFDEQLAALEQSAEDGPTSVSDEVDGQVEVTYPMDDAPLVVTVQKFEGSWFVAGTR